MKKAKGIFWGIVLLVLILLIVAICVVALNLDGIVKRGVETYGPQITKVSVQLDGVHIGLATGTASIKGLVVGNPEGYKSPEAIRVGTIAVGVNPFSILSDKIVVRSIKVESPEITFEGGLSGNNLSKIKDNVNGTPPSGLVITNTVEPASSGKKIEVDDLLITGAKVQGTLALFGGREISIPDLPLPDIHLTDLGTGPNGITAADLTRRVLDAIISATVKVVEKNATNLGEGATNMGKGSINQIKKGVGGLLGK
jgi:hypothetical protein